MARSECPSAISPWDFLPLLAPLEILMETAEPTWRYRTNGSLKVLLSNGNGTFQAAQNYPTGGLGRSIAVGDFNRDHKPDLLVVHSDSSSLLLGIGDGTFQTAQSYNVGGASIAVGDFNRDGRPDAAMSGTAVLLNIAH
jgi:hypothetical protein